jgi:molybdopterin-binding protein
MTRKTLISILLAVVISFAGLAVAEPLVIDKKATIKSVLENQLNNRITIKLDSGDELTGTVKSVQGKVTHLHALAGKEFYDAVISTDEIAAIIIRVKDR